MANCKKSVEMAWQLLLVKYPDTKRMYIFGEIFGGKYPHPNVTPIKNATKVQEQVFYCPHNEFYAFDIYNGQKYLDYFESEDIFKRSGFLYAEALLIAPFDQVLQMSNTFQTKLPEK